MTHRRAAWLVGLLVLLVTATPATALEEAVSDLVLIRDEDVIDDDLLAGGNVIRVKGKVEGDLVASAFESIEVDGTVTGDLLVAAPRVVIRGEVLGSVRSVAATTIIEGRVGGDLLLAGGTLTITGSVEGDLHGAVLGMTSDGDIGGNLVLRAVRSRVGGVVGGDIEGTVRRFVLDQAAEVEGDVAVRGLINVADGAEVGGSVRSPQARAVPLRARAFGLVGILVALSIWLLAGPAVRWLAPHWLERHLVRGSLRRWLGWGLGSVAVLLVLVGGLGLLTAHSSGEASIVLGVVTAFLAVAGLVLLASAALVGAVPVSMWIGDHIGSPPSRVAAHVRGVTAITFLAWVPWVGPLVVAVFVLLAVGAVAVRTEG